MQKTMQRVLTGNGDGAGENEEALNSVPDAGHCVEVMIAAARVASILKK